MADSVDYIFYGGDIVTIDERCLSPEALATKGQKIIALGNKDHVFSLAGPETKYVELKGHQTLLPGLIDPHQHPTHMILARRYVSCSGYCYRSYKQIRQIMEKTVAEVDPTSGKWCIFDHWDPLLVPDLPQLSAEILDELSRDVPILVRGQSCHDAWANHKAFEIAGITYNSEDPDGGSFERDEAAKKLTGKLLEPVAFSALLNYAPQSTREDFAQAVDNVWREYACSGFTTVAELLYNPNEILERVMQEKAAQPDCPMRLAIYKVIFRPEDVSTVTIKDTNLAVPSNQVENNKIWFAGVKIIADGSPRCGSIATREPFLENAMTELLGFQPSPNYGSLNFSDEQLHEMVKHSHEEGKQIAIHAHGERAIEQVLNVYEQVIGGSPEALDRRHRMEHLGLCQESHMIRAAKLNLALSFFVAHLYFYGKAYAESILGEERTKRWAPVSLATKHNLCWTIHQDNPALPGPPSPFANMKVAITRTQRGAPDVVYGKEYCISIEEALKAYTINAAWQIHKEKELGSLTVGKRADLVIVSDNPLKVDPFDLEHIKVIDTFLDGRSNNISEKNEVIVDGKIVLSYLIR